MEEQEYTQADAAKNSKESFNLAISALRNRLEQSRVVIGDCSLYCEDCEFVLPTLCAVDHVIMDPPYEKEAHDPGRRLNGRTATLKNAKVREIHSKPLSFSALSAETRENVSSHCAKLSGGWILAFCQVEAVKSWKDALENGGALYRRAMAWVKPDSSPQLSGDRPAQGYEAIVSAWAGKGRSVWNGGGSRGVFTFGKHDAGTGHGGAANVHETQKPIALMKHLVGLFTQCGQTILDPFMGSGTTGVACVQMGRKFIGIERERKYFDIACERIQKAYAQPDMFFSSVRDSKEPTQTEMMLLP